MTRDEMWKEFENQLKREVHTPMTMSYDDSVRCAELGIEEVVTKWKERLEQESKTGHWILTDDDFVYCSECEDSYYPRPIDASWYYCPHCGAKMIEPQESEDTE